jgi:hypothetical protein
MTDLPIANDRAEADRNFAKMTEASRYSASVETPKKTRGQEIAADISALLRARNPLIWIVTREEARVEQLLVEAAASASYLPRTWDVGQGCAQMDGLPLSTIGGTDPGDMFTAIRERAAGRSGAAERGLWIMRDLAPWLGGPGGITTLRQLRNLARLLPGVPRERAQAIIVLTPSAEVPAELANHATVVEWPLPDRQEIAAILDGALEALPPDSRRPPRRTARATPRSTPRSASPARRPRPASRARWFSSARSTRRRSPRRSAGSSPASASSSGSTRSRAGSTWSAVWRT